MHSSIHPLFKHEFASYCNTMIMHFAISKAIKSSPSNYVYTKTVESLLSITAFKFSLRCSYA